MNKYISCLAILAITLACNSTPGTSTMKKELKTDNEKFSYAIGQEIGVSLMQFKSNLDLNSVFQGIQDTLGGKKMMLTVEEAKAIKTSVFQKLQEVKMKEMTAAGEKNKKTGDEFLAKNKAEKGVITTASGLQYTIITQGTGPKPKETDKVKVNYKGTLIDGTEFDNSYKRGEPAVFPVTGVIKGWTEALLLLNVGSKVKLVIPSELAYGERGAGGTIQPGAVLIFEMELLGIEK